MRVLSRVSKEQRVRKTERGSIMCVMIGDERLSCSYIAETYLKFIIIIRGACIRVACSTLFALYVQIRKKKLLYGNLELDAIYLFMLFIVVV